MILDFLGRPTQARRTLTTSNPSVARFVSMAQDPFQTLGLTVVCDKCGATPTMANDVLDTTWAMDCGCTTRRLRNPERSH